jgi:hypothetical protein
MQHPVESNSSHLEANFFTNDNETLNTEDEGLIGTESHSPESKRTNIDTLSSEQITGNSMQIIQTTENNIERPEKNTSSTSPVNEVQPNSNKRIRRVPQKMAAYESNLMNSSSSSSSVQHQKPIVYKVDNKQNADTGADLMIGLHNDFLQHKNYVTLPACGNIGEFITILLLPFFQHVEYKCIHKIEN